MGDLPTHDPDRLALPCGHSFHGECVRDDLPIAARRRGVPATMDQYKSPVCTKTQADALLQEGALLSMAPGSHDTGTEVASTCGFSKLTMITWAMLVPDLLQNFCTTRVCKILDSFTDHVNTELQGAAFHHTQFKSWMTASSVTSWLL